MKMLFVLAVTAIAATYGEETRLDDLPPNEAQQILDKQDLSLKYAPKIDSNVPALRYLGKEQHEVLEDIYLARQFHGQDGTGGYVYGYSVPDIAKAEKKQAGGDLKGSYSYINGDGQEIKVEYYDDGTGFHHMDNLPKVELVQIEDTPEVKAAKEEHLRIWNEIAARNKDYNPNAVEEENTYQDESGSYNEADERQYNPPEEKQEPITDPRGFFYSYDYPVGIIVDKGRAVQGGATLQKRNTDFDKFNELYNRNRAILNGHRTVRSVAFSDETPIKESRISARAVKAGAIPIAAVHDAQVPYYLRNKIVNVQTYPVYFHQ